ncbi:MAG: mechanosensitive ion channel, partial [Caldilineaceae bacterium]|nr:mechanosensitive ion channel [Caldilineaceae bacterium]
MMTFLRTLVAVLVGIVLIVTAPNVLAQDTGTDSTQDAESTIEAPDQVDVQPVARDEEIANRLMTILRATEWFRNPTVTVRDGVVFLDGQSETEEYRTWAGNLARNTQDVVAVVNRLEVIQRSPWDFTPAFTELRSIGRESLQILPLILFGALILVVAWFAMRYTSALADRLLRRRVQNGFLRNLATTALSIPVFLLGLYLVLQVSGLTRLAITVLGGTGIAGLIVGIGFRDIMENFLATILISTRNPFKTGDRIEVAGHLGIVQQVNSRTTVLMSLDGNHIQIPNAIVYKSTIRNFTANPKRRLEFGVGIGYDDDLAAAQQTIIDTLSNHPTVLATPEPLALVDGLGAATVNLRIYFWVDTSR